MNLKKQIETSSNENFKNLNILGNYFTVFECFYKSCRVSNTSQIVGTGR